MTRRTARLRRSSLALWAAALALTAAPYVWTPATTEEHIGVAFGKLGYYPCLGFDLWFEAIRYTSMLATVPAPLLVAAAFAIWAVLTTAGFHRTARAVGWLAVVALLAGPLITYGPAGLDILLSGGGCLDSWRPFLTTVAPGFLWLLYHLLIAGLIILAVRLRRTGPVRRGRVSRVAAALGAALLLALLPVMDTVPGKITSAYADVCEPATMGRNPRFWRPSPDRETAFVCVARNELPERFAQTPDRELIALGRHLCGVELRGDPSESTAAWQKAGLYPGYGTIGMLRLLCPDLDAKLTAQEKAEQDRYRAEAAAADRRCVREFRHRPLTRPVWVIRDRVWTDYGVLEAVEGGPGSADPFQDGLLKAAQRNGLVAARPGHLIVLNDPDGDMCVIAETYRRRPPVETKGWDHVVEVGYDSPTGDLRLMDTLSGAELPNLAVQGKGRYRVRIHYRGPDPARDGRQDMLIMVYPGRDDRAIVHRAPARS